MARRSLARRATNILLTLVTVMTAIVTGSGNVTRSDGWSTRLAHAVTTPIMHTTAFDEVDGAVRQSLLSITHTVITVTTTLDELDGDTSSFERLKADPGGEGISLREALIAANAERPGPPLRIHFAIPDSDPGYNSSTLVWRIRPNFSALPVLERGNIVIDGTTQPGATLVSHPVIVLDGTDVYEGASGLNGLTITSASNVIRGLALVSFWDAGVVIQGENAYDNVIARCFIGVLPPGVSMDGPPSYYGIDIRDGARNNLIGGVAAADRNIIGGNENAGVRIDGSATISNTVAGNWIGVDASGRRVAGNKYYGVVVSGGAHRNAIGTPGHGNVISGNDHGVMIWNARENSVVGNVIGLAPDRSTPMGNREGGVFLINGASGNVVGGETEAERNIISGNGYGVFVGRYYEITPADARLNRVLGNYIGVDPSGILPRGNMREGIVLNAYAERNVVGGVHESAGNVIAYNGGNGLSVAGSANQIAYNLIGVGADALTPLGNQRHGALITGNGNVVGPFNTFASNQLSGLLIEGDNTFVQGNVIYRNARSGMCVKGDGSTIISNTIRINQALETPWDGFDAQRDDCTLTSGIVLTGTSLTLIRSNTISDNAAPGVTIFGGARNRVSGNSITANAGGGILLLNGANGGIEPPTIQHVDQTEVRGVACRGCHVEIFADPGNQGREFLGATRASETDGAFSFLIVGSALSSLHITATSTDASGNTSAFAAWVNVPQLPITHTIHLPLVIR
ncbi:MAG: right-handed parallel beta-helix repeat-containing protein [Roseiflexus sp.]|nr:right-handed parallel beta-helix repeat-containing protein [Roseiflexus sp.]MCS7290632.1 right-handed parallel beta-helix repeat-containing protein [Roseiflexus sp.]MDW8145504.1 right-handed parallel beta-helix repeat-containing protein [Roseiflexaceae bacterium]MDW8231424.1 right-handed parallel beta-helix repeat-containing protein [Roseiflexaceae bacterium]